MAYIQGELIVNNDDILLPRTVTEQVAVTANQNLKEKLNEMDANIESVTNEVKDARTNGNTNITYNNLKARLDDEHKKLNNEIEKTNTQLFENSLKAMEDLTYIRPEWLASWNENDSSTAINEALATQKKVKLGSKIYRISHEITLKTNSYLEGNGKLTTIQLNPNSQIDSMIKVEDETVKNITLRDFHLFGDLRNQSSNYNGIDLSTSFKNADDARQSVSNVFIEQIKGDGFIIQGRGGNVIDNVQILWCENDGFVINTWDSAYSNCNAGSIYENAWHIQGTTNHFMGCKGWWANFGLKISASRCTFSQCEAQDCLYPIELEGWDNRLEVYVDGAGEKGDNSSLWIEGVAITLLKNNGRNVINGTVTDRREYSKEGTTYYVLDDKGGYYNQINLEFSNVRKDFMKDASTISTSSIVCGRGQLKDGSSSAETSKFFNSDFRSTVVGLANGFTATDNKVTRSDNVIQVLCKVSHLNNISSGTGLGTVVTPNFRPLDFTDIICSCDDGSGNVTGFCTVNCSPSTGSLTAWNVPSNTKRITISGFYLANEWR